MLDGADITRWPPSRRVRGGLVLVPEGRRIVMSLTVHENLLMGAFDRHDMRAVGAEIDDIYRAVPEPGGAAACAGLGAVGWRAADARDRPRAPGRLRNS